MTRDDVEAVVWRAMTRPDERPLGRRVEAVLAAVDAHVAARAGITAERRATLAATPATRKRDQRATRRTT